ncbi:long-chain fatty acid-CoA ligase, partial [Mycoemilia scoparia]
MSKLYDPSIYPKTWSTLVNKDESIYRNIIAADGLYEHPNNDTSFATFYDLLKYSVSKYTDKIAIGDREVLETITEEKQVKSPTTPTSAADDDNDHHGEENIKETTKKWNYFKLSPYNWLNYIQVFEHVNQFGSGLRHLGLEKGSRVLIYAPTSKEWLLTAFACASQSFEVVTAYDTLGEDGLKHAAISTETSTIFTKVDKLPIIARVCKDSAADIISKSLKNVIYYGEPITEDHQKSISEIENLGVKIHFLENVKALGKQNPYDPNPSGAADTALIMFTSGSTGQPKGVLISNKNLISLIAGVEGLISSYINLIDEEYILAYLPLAHILEFIVESICIFRGIAIGYGTKQTISNDNVRGCLGDIQELRPTIMIGVPQVWDTIRSSILHTVQERGRFISKLFNSAVTLKSFLAKRSLPTGPIDVLFKKVKDQVGGRLKFIITGGAPISRETQNFFEMTLCPVIQGYGMTETSGLIAVQMPGDKDLDTVGAPVPSIEIKLVDVEELGYFSKNNQGEVWVRGATVFQNYLNNQEETKKTLTDDGWLKTGDVGQWLPDGKLRLIDRIKNLVKLSQGEYVALEKVESVYKTSLYVGNICVVANSYMKQPVGIIFPNVKAAASWAKKNGVNFTGLADLINSSSGYKKQIMADINDIAKKNGFAKFEQLQDIILDEE